MTIPSILAVPRFPGMMMIQRDPMSGGREIGRGKKWPYHDVLVLMWPSLSQSLAALQRSCSWLQLDLGGSLAASCQELLGESQIQEFHSIGILLDKIEKVVLELLIRTHGSSRSRHDNPTTLWKIRLSSDFLSLFSPLIHLLIHNCSPWLLTRFQSCGNPAVQHNLS